MCSTLYHKCLCNFASRKIWLFTFASRILNFLKSQNFFMWESDDGSAVLQVLSGGLGRDFAFDMKQTRSPIDVFKIG